MTINKLKVGPIELPGNVLMAPLAGYTDFAFRSIALRLGASLAFTEMVSCKGLLYNNANTAVLLVTDPSEKIKAAQIFGNDPAVMRAACESEYLSSFDIIDINMGCPVPKLFNNGEGSALLKDIALAEKIVAACVASEKTITVKIRTGIEKGESVAREFAKMCEGAGASMVTVHGRPRSAYYTGEVDYKSIAEAKKAVSIPVIANGGIFTAADADDMMEKTGADGVMIARGAMYDPYIFAEITRKTHKKDYVALIREQAEGLCRVYPESFVARYMRKQAICYFRGVRGGKRAKADISEAMTINDLIAVAERVFNE